MKYNIIYADPPWKYGGGPSKDYKPGDDGIKWLPAGNYYPTMSFEELEELNIKSLAADNCLLFLWVVNSALTKCIKVGEAWGFKYSTVGFVWFKQRAQVGNYTMSQCELCLIFKHGRIPLDRVRNPGTMSFLAQKITGHSEKPDEIRRRIGQMFPISKKVELFAKKKVPGWDAIGMEIDGKTIQEKIDKQKDK